MEAAVWTAIGLCFATSLGSLFYLGSRIDALTARMESRFDRMDARMDSIADKLSDHIEHRFG
jgi:hypothetical protein